MFTKLADSRAFLTIEKLRFVPAALEAVTGPGGGDPHVDFGVRNRLFYVERSAARTAAAVSERQGQRLPLDRNNPLSCIGGRNDQDGATYDRQGVAAFGDGIAYSTVRNPAVAVGSGNCPGSRFTWINF